MVVVPAVPVEACLIPPEIMSISSAVGAGAVVVVGTVVVAVWSLQWQKLSQLLQAQVF